MRPVQQTKHVFRIMSKNVRAFKTTVGMSLQQFDFLICDVEKAYRKAESGRLARPDHKLRVGIGRGFSLHLRDQVLLTLVYYLTYLTQNGTTRLLGCWGTCPRGVCSCPRS